jgi:transcriptional regulator with XRE-family HTH domain
MRSAPCGKLGVVAGRSDLGDFLRARREALRPADVGLAGGGRRRTPGLRREEVAALAGVSIDYLIRIEQGRDTHPSPAVLAALASALRLADDERTHMARLAALTHSRELCPEATPLDAGVAPGVRHLLDELASTPAFVVGPIGNVVAWNGAWERIVSPLGFLDHTPVNLARYVFTDPRAREAFVDWPAAADEQVARLRAAEPRWGTDPDFVTLLADLSAGEEFASRWSSHRVAEKHRGTKGLRMPDVGDLSVAYEVLLLADDEQQLVTWRGADGASVARIADALDGRRPVSPAQLTVVVNR